MTAQLILKNGLVYIDGELHRVDVECIGGKITRLEKEINSTAEKVIDVEGHYILPGLIDTHLHFREPGLEHKEDLESGSKAAAAGGICSFFEMPNTKPLTTSAAALEDKLARARGRSWCDYAFFIGASRSNVDQIADLEQLPGCAGVKVFMGSSTGNLLVPDDDFLLRVLQNGTRRVAIHAEDEPRLCMLKEKYSNPESVEWHPRLRDAKCSRMAVQRLISLLENCKRPVHVLHVSTADEVELLRAFIGSDALTAEVTPQHLQMVAPECYKQLDTFAQMNPPIRDASHNEELWKGLEENVFSTFGSDHAPHLIEEKQQAYPASPSGMPGVETMLPLMLDAVNSRRLRLNQLVSMLAENPANLFSIKGKGFIKKGYQADFSIVDMNCNWTIDQAKLHSRCGWSPFHGRKLSAALTHTIIRGQLVFANGEHHNAPIGEMLKFDF
jgi:dihydroorotase